MKKLFFSFVMLVTLVIVAGSVKGQTNVTPYIGSTYQYTISGLDQVSTTRAIEVFLTLDDQSLPESARIDKALYTVSNGSGISGISAVGTTANNYGYTASIVVGTSPALTPNSFSFDVTWNSGLTLDTKYNLWVKVYDGASGTCSNMMHLNVTPKANKLDFSILANNNSKTDIQCPATSIPSDEKTDAVNNTTDIIYKISRIDGNDAYDWSFKLAIDPTSFGPSNQAVSVAYSVVNGSIVSGSGFGNEIKVRGTNSVVATITINNNPGAPDKDFKGTLSDMTQYVNQTSTVNSIGDLTNTNNDATTTLKRIPSITGFDGN